MTEPEDPGHKFNPQHRIIGAVVLVALAVLLIPLVLKNRESKSQAAPAAAAGALSGSVTVPAAPPALPMTPGPAVPESSSAAVSPNSAASAPAQESAPTPAPAQAPAPAQPVAAQAPVTKHVSATAAVHRRPVLVRRVTRGWIVQVGAFSERVNALRVRARLERKGFRAELDELRVGYRRVARVRVGPVRSRGEARILEAHIARDTGIKGVVLTYP